MILIISVLNPWIFFMVIKAIIRHVGVSLVQLATMPLNEQFMASQILSIMKLEKNLAQTCILQNP